METQQKMRNIWILYKGEHDNVPFKGNKKFLA